MKVINVLGNKEFRYLMDSYFDFPASENLEISSGFLFPVSLLISNIKLLFSDCDFTILHGNSAFFYLLLPKKFRKKTIYVCDLLWNDFYQLFPPTNIFQKLIKRINKFWEEIAIKKADIIITQSKFFQNRIKIKFDIHSILIPTVNEKNILTNSELSKIVKLYNINREISEIKHHKSQFNLLCHLYIFDFNTINRQEIKDKLICVLLSYI